MKNISLHPDTIAEVKEKVDLVEVVSDYVVMQKKGRDFVGLCPFHDEKSPSFTVSQNKQLYYCFGCGAGGGAIKFLMEIGKQSFRDVIFNLAGRYQIPIKTLAVEDQEEIQKQISLRDQLYEILAVATNFYQYSLQQGEGQEALRYLKNQRNLSPENIEKFKLGYAPEGWQTLYHYLVEIKHYSVILVEQTGLIKKKSKGEGYIDYFRDRLMIPIQDINGKIIAFGARSLDGSEPKYLNSPETNLFSKSKTLFALNFAQKNIIKQDKAIIVEGYFDAITLHNYGIDNVVAVLGTALTEHHIKQLSRYTESKEIIVNFDADKAGLKATQRAIKEVENLVYSGQLKLKILTIPNGKDADEFLQSSEDSGDKYQELINKSPLWLDWQIEQIINNKNLQNSADYELAFQSLVKLLNKITNNATKDYYLSSCAEILSTKRSQYLGLNSQDFKKIHQSLQFALKQNSYNSYYKKKNYKNIDKSIQNNQVEQSEFLLLLIYLHCPDYRQIIINQLDEKDLVFSLVSHRFLWQKIHQVSLSLNTNNDHNYLLNTVQENMVNNPDMAKKLSNFFNLNENQKQFLFQPEHYIQAAIACLETVKLEKYKQYCQQKITELTQEKDLTKMTYYYQEIIATEAELVTQKSLRMD
ncbi:DNA primase [Geminocystis sp. NIES-3708]|uniref:DNA primase n=1 Tax=Geminocystis sp. NIES-3708 TaxID=1615909 RepID=UPI0005FCB0B6|nr:DNA primase [Geminocystis sp. NIES-3708]BAQ62763.1 DNA primase [Geminocystis sp. NIES-3708]